MGIDAEVWKDIPGLGGHYMASSQGRIMSKPRVVRKRHRSGCMSTQRYKERILNPHIGKGGYLLVKLGLNGEAMTRSVHSLVLEAFVGPRPEGMEACHNNGVESDNRPENLRWDTHLNNNRDRVLHGTYPTGTCHPMAKLSKDEALEIKRRLDAGESGMALSTEFSISPSHVSRIRNGNHWALAS